MGKSRKGQIFFTDGQKTKKVDLDLTGEVLLNQKCTIRIIDLEPVNETKALISPENEEKHVFPYGFLLFENMGKPLYVNENNITISLSLLRLFGSKGGLMGNCEGLSGEANLYEDFKNIDNEIIFKEGAFIKDIFVTIFDDNISEFNENFSLIITNIRCSERRNCTLQRDLPKKEIIIQENDNPFGQFTLKISKHFAEEPDLISIIINRISNSLQPIELYIKSFSKEASGDLTEKEEQIIQHFNLLCNKSERAEDFNDYLPLNEKIIFFPQDKQKEINFYIKDDPFPEKRECLLIYLYSPFIQFKNTNLNHLKIIYIEANDFWKGLLFFKKQSYSFQEDEGKPLKIPVMRNGDLNDTIIFQWQLFNFSSSLQKRKTMLLSNKIKFSGENVTYIILQFDNDNIPENVSKCYLSITTDDKNAIIETSKSTIEINFLPNDSPYGLMEFEKKFLTVRLSDDFIRFNVSRKGFIKRKFKFKLSLLPQNIDSLFGKKFPKSNKLYSFNETFLFEENQVFMITICVNFSIFVFNSHIWKYQSKEKKVVEFIN